MNKEYQVKFKKVIKARKRRKAFLKRIKDYHGAKLPIDSIPFKKSKKFKKKKERNLKK